MTKKKTATKKKKAAKRKPRKKQDLQNVMVVEEYQTGSAANDKKYGNY